MSLPVRGPVRRPFGLGLLSAGDAVVALVGLFAGVLFSAAPATAQQTEGMYVTVPNPINSDAIAGIARQVEARMASPERKPATVIFDFNPGDKPASAPKFGVCRDLAQVIRDVNQKYGAGTVAFVHAKVSGHAVLPVLACRELVVSKDGQLGEVAGENVEPLQDPDRAAYRHYFDRPDRFALVEKMYDPEVELRSGVGQGDPAWAGKKVYVDARNPFVKVAGMTPVAGVQDHAIGLYNARTARDVGLSTGSADSPEEVLALYNLPPGIVHGDPLQGRAADVYKWVLKGDVDGAMQEAVARVIRDVRKKGGNVLILVVNCEGNDLVTARRIADDLVKAQEPGDEAVKVIAFVPQSAPAAAAVVALGCTEIVMYRPKPGTEGKEAEIGDFAGYVKAAKAGDRDANLASVRELAVAHGYPGVLIDGMFNKDLEIVRAVNRKDARLRRLMTREQYQNEQAEWAEDKVVKPKGQLLKLGTTAALEYGLARLAVEGTDVRDVCAAYGYKDAKDPDPGWLGRFADFLKIPVVTVLLVVIGFTGLILELKVPGLTVPGIIAALCFIMVFWAHSRFSGQTFVLAMLLFLLGLVLVGLEIFVLPGFGVCGIFGILCMLAGLGLVTLDKIPQTEAEWGGLGVRVSQYLFSLMGAMALALLIARFLPRLPGANRLVLNAPADTASPADALPGAGEAAGLLGAIGTTSTPLRPAGVVKFGDKFVDVVSDGGFVPAGTRVQVIQVEGTRIVVKEV